MKPMIAAGLLAFLTAPAFAQDAPVPSQCLAIAKTVPDVVYANFTPVQAEGETVTITDRGRPVAQLSPVAASRLESLVRAGLARPARRNIVELPAPEPGPPLSATLAAMRDEERF